MHWTTKSASLLVGFVAWAATPSLAIAQQPTPSPAKSQDFGAEFDALSKRFETALEAFHAELNLLYENFDEQKATDEERAALEKKRAELDEVDPTPGFVKEFAALAGRAKGTEVAAKALMQVLQYDQTPPRTADNPGRDALTTLLTDHIKSPALTQLPMILEYASSIDQKLRSQAFRKLVSESPIDAVKAGSLFALATDLSADESRGGDRVQARAMFVDLKTRFGKLDSPRRKTYGALADGFVYELDHLQLGMQAPDFDAIDENGVKFKLSEYAGKVVVVDFWGFW